jgi:pilus assembly protein CpaC
MRILAEPTLVAMSGEDASFLAGGEFPVPIAQNSSGTGTTITVEYKEYGIRLKFHPTVLGENVIRLSIAPEVSELSDAGAVIIQGFSIPSIVTRKAQTTLELKSGQTFAMAGLINHTATGRNSRIPGLGDLPVLGAMFRSVRYENDETELVVMVKASLVNPFSAGQPPPVPGDTHAKPNDWELYAMGAIEGQAPKLSKAQAAWLEQSGLSKLRGPGGWVSSDARPAEAPHNDSPAPAGKPSVSKPVVNPPPAAKGDKSPQGSP